jgi:hypothetical protein
LGVNNFEFTELQFAPDISANTVPVEVNLNHAVTGTLETGTLKLTPTLGDRTLASQGRPNRVARSIVDRA